MLISYVYVNTRISVSWCLAELANVQEPRGVDRLRTASKLRRVGFVGLIMLAWAACLRGQEISVQNGSSAAVQLKAADIATLPHQDATVDDHGKTVKFTGVPLKLVLEQAGVTFGESLRGKRLAAYLLVEAADGYKVVFALPELDPGFTDRVILLADQADGHALDNKQGPFRVIVPGEKRAARWVRQVTALKVVEVQ